jgi:adenosyl cobinamide kinase/adenosyl cobinamide phosphate guanylyltransferase
MDYRVRTGEGGTNLTGTFDTEGAAIAWAAGHNPGSMWAAEVLDPESGTWTQVMTSEEARHWAETIQPVLEQVQQAVLLVSNLQGRLRSASGVHDLGLALGLVNQCLQWVSHPGFIPTAYSVEREIDATLMRIIELTELTPSMLEEPEQMDSVTMRLLECAKRLADHMASSRRQDDPVQVKELTTSVATTLQAVDYSVRLRRESETVETLRADAQEAKRDWELVASDAGTEEMWDHFSTLANSELRQANTFRWVTVVSLIASVAYTAHTVISAHESTQTDAETFQRLALTLALLAFAGYVARESGHHRRAGRWSQLIAVQLRSVRAYTAPLPEDIRAEVLGRFADRVFSAAPAGKEADSLPASQALEMLTRSFPTRNPGS